MVNKGVKSMSNYVHESFKYLSPNIPRYMWDLPWIYPKGNLQCGIAKTRFLLPITRHSNPQLIDLLRVQKQ